jgi:Peptidase family M50
MTSTSQVLDTPPSSLTPILDRIIPVPHSRGRTQSEMRVAFLGGLITVPLGMGLILVGKKFVPGLAAHLLHDFNWSTLFPLFLPLLVWSCVCIIVHETGHLIAGLCAGLRFNFISFGPLLINRDLKASFHWKQRSGAVGLTSMLPNGSHQLRWRLLIMVLGGPLANLMSAAAVMIYQVHSGNSSSVLGVFVWVSVYLGLGSLVPFRTISVLSDGKRIWLLLLQKQKSERWLAVTQLVTALNSGAQPDQLDKELLQAAVSFVDNSPDTVSAHALAYMAAFAAHRDDEAARFLETCLAYGKFTAASEREGLFISAAIFQARRRGRVDLAEQWLALVPVKTQTPGLRSQAEAAILEAQGRIEDALSKLNESKAAVAAIPQPSLRVVSLASLDRWKKELLAEAPAALPAKGC